MARRRMPRSRNTLGGMGGRNSRSFLGRGLGRGYGSSAGGMGYGTSQYLMRFGAKFLDGTARIFGIKSNLTSRLDQRSRVGRGGLLNEQFRELSPLQYQRLTPTERRRYDRELAAYNKRQATQAKKLDKESKKNEADLKEAEFFTPVIYSNVDDYIGKPSVQQSLEMTEEEREAMDTLAKYNEGSAPSGDINAEVYENMPALMKKLYGYMETVNPYYKELKYMEKDKNVYVFPKELKNPDMEIFNYIILDEKGIYNPEGENYILLGDNDPSLVMTKLLNDYQFERGTLIYVVVNYYFGNHRKDVYI